MPFTARSYVSPTLVLLAFDYPEGENQPNFLGFAIRRQPGFNQASSSYLPNRIGFDGPPPDSLTKGSDQWPIQKFYWWDANITTNDRGKTTFTYTIQPVTGTSDNLFLGEGIDILAAIPPTVVKGIGTFFNRAVVSSQSFVNRCGHNPTGQKLHDAYKWLGNGMEQVVADFLQNAKAAECDVEGAIYHLTQTDQGEFIISTMAEFRSKLSLVYNEKDGADQAAIRQLEPAGVEFLPRTKTHIMHSKFLVSLKRETAVSLVMGSANYTTEGLTSQANLMHTFASPALAQLYLDRKRLIQDDPSLASTTSMAAWSASLRK